ncbi:DUF3973 domain-containing protein [Paenibacillus sp. V4I5]|uniref:DUF3973 domain-containing protein n=1 Tax=Paenibacillus sp. V4I5 TaxID=3042306 RepID=UPI0027942CA7|nr:hypothetical protein [Paenibacillus sp. V4I5]
MYYCISCEKKHELMEISGKVFRTGFMFYEGKKTPLGICYSLKHNFLMRFRGHTLITRDDVMK